MSIAGLIVVGLLGAMVIGMAWLYSHKDKFEEVWQ